MEINLDLISYFWQFGEKFQNFGEKSFCNDFFFSALISHSSNQCTGGTILPWSADAVNAQFINVNLFQRNYGEALEKTNRLEPVKKTTLYITRIRGQMDPLIFLQIAYPRRWEGGSTLMVSLTVKKRHIYTFFDAFPYTFRIELSCTMKLPILSENGTATLSMGWPLQLLGNAQRNMLFLSSWFFFHRN